MAGLPVDNALASDLSVSPFYRAWFRAERCLQANSGLRFGAATGVFRWC